MDIIAIMSHKKTDPILLTAICTFALDLFETEELRVNQDIMEPFYNCISDLNYMIPYLGFDSYFDLLQMTRGYHNAKGGAKQLMATPGDGGNEGEEKNNQNQSSQAQQILASMSHLDDPIANALFISIIRLIRYFCLEAVQNKVNKLFESISESLNNNNREKALFNCLMIPNDDVRLACVECLFVVPLDEFDLEEINYITKIMSTCNNLGAGKTELVLSVIYWICTKLVAGDPETEESTNIFQSKFGEKTIKEAMIILSRNLEREIELEDEDYEKYALSLSILNFLKAASRSPNMVKHFTGQNHVFKKILLNEELYSTSMVNQVPIDIENSVYGKEVSCLFECLSGNQCVQPYCDTSFRVINKMADVLMFKHRENFSFEITENEGVIEDLMEHQKRLYRRKKSKELDFWIDKPYEFNQSLVKAFGEDEMRYFKEQHYSFTRTHKDKGPNIIT